MTGTELRPAAQAVVEDFARYLSIELGRSSHTTRAYVSDASSLLEHAARMSRPEPGQLDLTVLRSWLARQRTLGAARATLARRASSARTLTAFGVRRGWLETDPGPLLANPTPHHTLPRHLDAGQAAAVLELPIAASAAAEAAAVEAAAVEAAAGETAEPGLDLPPLAAPAAVALGLRNAAIVELLYATGVRVSELCGLDLGAVDHRRRTLRVRGKGDKERTVPFGVPAARALDLWLEDGRPLLSAGATPAAFLGARGNRIDPREVRRVVHGAVAAVPGTPDIGPHGLRHSAATTCWRGAPTCAPYKSCSDMPAWRRRRDTPTSPPSGSGRSTRGRIPGRERSAGPTAESDKSRLLTSARRGPETLFTARQRCRVTDDIHECWDS